MDSNSSPKRIMASFEGFLTKEARATVDQAEKAGMDRDLAIATLEVMWPESEVYTLEEES